MNREALNKLRLDRRLIRRRGWIGGAELERALEELPDRASKGVTLGEISDERSDSGRPADDDASPAA
jgi:hypothetical protein